ncbi:MAG: START domain-containing protein [Vicingaceae bacterium]
MRRLTLLICLLFALFKLNSQNKAWKLKKDKDKIQVYTRSVEGYNLAEFKGESVFNYSVKTLATTIKDVEQHPQWVANCDAVRLLKEEGNKMWVYSTTNAPFPLSDRDGIMLFKFQKQSNGIKVHLQSDADYIPKKEGYVRLPYVKGFWLLESKGENKTKVTYQIHADPGGSIPAWLANATAVESPFETLANLREYLKDQ